jgi:NAD-dependent DNA ligase
LKTGTLPIFEKERDKPEYILSEIYGVGPKKAKELVEKGITNISQLRERQDELLNDVQRVGLKYYEDILERIPRSEIDEYNKIFEEAFVNASAETPESKYEIVGSYRRGAQTSGDIDAIITTTNPEVFQKFVDILKEKEIILEILSRGKTKCLVITKLPGVSKARRVDFMYTSPEEFPFAILYFTGSKTFNTVMRGHALKMGLSLNEHGLYKKIGKEKEEKIETVFGDEKDIFAHLNLQYKEPVDRIDGRSVVILPGTIMPTIQKTLKIPKEKTLKIPKEPKVPKEKKERKTRKNKKNDTLMEIPEPITKPDDAIIEEDKEVIKDSELSEEFVPIVPVIHTDVLPKAKLIIKVPKNKTLKKEPKSPKKKTIKNNIEINGDNIVKEKRKMSAKTESKKLVKEFKEKGISLLETLSEKQITDMIIVSNDAYYNSKPLLTDNEYDIIREYAENKYPENEKIRQVGAPIEKNKITLPYNMPSMDKIKPDTNALENWSKKYTGPYVLSCKLDGVSGMYTTEGSEPKLYTRGDGKIGQDITHLLKYIKFPAKKDDGIVVRGEFIIPKAIFDEKYKSQFANPRNLVSGIINSKNIDDKIKDIHFVAYEVIKPYMVPSEQMKDLSEQGFETVQNATVPALTNELLSETLIDWRTNYQYEIDGVIVADDNLHVRKDGNPEHAFAFKMVISDQLAEAKVVDVLWNPSKNGYLKPRVQIEPIRLGGVTIEFATGFNGSFIESKKIGVGALIQIVRSGDVIPYIKDVITPAEKAKMPDIPYHWTDTHVDIIIDNVGEDITVREKNITAFFTSLEVVGLSEGNIKRIMKAGFDTVPKIIFMTKTDFEKVDGFKEKMIEKVFTGIREKLDGATLIQIMAASNMFGRGIGERKITPIMNAFPNILTSKDSNEEKIIKLKSISGIGPENAKSFVEHIDDFMKFLRECGLESKLDVAPLPLANVLITEVVNHELYGKKIVMTKVRDKEIIEFMKSKGASLEDNIKKDTFILIVKTKDDVSNKTKYATENNIPIMTPDDFKVKYM